MAQHSHSRRPSYPYQELPHKDLPVGESKLHGVECRVVGASIRNLDGPVRLAEEILLGYSSVVVSRLHWEVEEIDWSRDRIALADSPVL